MSAATNPLTNLLIEQAARLDVPIDATILAKLGRYQALLTEWGDKINLTALRDPTDVAVRHFLDSLALVRELPTPEELAQLGLPCTLVDVGSGAGFPGALCALCRPALRVTLVERIGKKAAFLQTLRRELGLHYEVAADDAERIIKRGEAGFGIAVARAALVLPEWLELGSRLVAPGGWIFAMTTPREPLPTNPALSLVRDVTYDVGAGTHRLLGYRLNS